MTHAQTRGGQDMRLILCMVEEPEYLMMIVLIFLFDHDTITTQHITPHTQSGTSLPQPLPLTFGLNFKILDFWLNFFKII